MGDSENNENNDNNENDEVVVIEEIISENIPDSPVKEKEVIVSPSKKKRKL